MTHESVVEQLRLILVEQGVPAEKARAGQHLTDDLGLDSLKALELVCAVEEAFSVQIPDQDLTRVATIDDMAECVLRLAAAPHPAVDGA